MNQAALSMLHPLRRIRIISAGIWNNIVMALFAYWILSSLPVMFGLFYKSNCYADSRTEGLIKQQGLISLEVKPGSPLLGHIPIHSHITRVFLFCLTSRSTDIRFVPSKEAEQSQPGRMLFKMHFIKLIPQHLDIVFQIRW
jgi:hypothetical protein